MTVDYTCLDGSPFPVEFANPDDARLTWAVDREHAPTSMAPLAEAVRRVGRDGSHRAYEECGLEPPSTLRPPPRANGYDYVTEESMPADEGMAFAEGIRRLSRDHGGTMAVWLDRCLPAVKGACARLRAAPPETPYSALADDRCYAWSQTSVAGVVARFDLQALAAICGDDDRTMLLAHQLAQGFANDTTAADLDLARGAGLSPGSAAAAAARTAFLADYGEQTTSWPIDHPTLTERPDLVDAQLSLLRRTGRRGVDVGAATERRKGLTGEVRSRLGEADRITFDRRLARIDAFVPVREARARWQLVASGAMRAAVQSRGAELADAGVIDRADDVFFLLPDEYDNPPTRSRDLVSRRRAEHAHWMGITPPTRIGIASFASRSDDGDSALHGVAGAPGQVTGTARVIVDLAHADRLGPGDVLVTTMTSPPWTPLLAVAGAVVTDSGDPMSHSAIAAREYGIPCVVGTHHATVVVADGDQLTVDGDTGIVYVNQPRRP